MGRWTRHLDALTQAISGMGAPSAVIEREVGSATLDLAEQPSPAVETSMAESHKTNTETDDFTLPAADTLEQALMQGMEVALGDLESTANGWMYRGHPVMVFAVDVAAVEDQQVRREFFHRVHLASCCGALEDPAQPVWIGTARDVLAAPGLEQSPHACEYCLTKVNHRGYRSLGPRDRARAAAALSFHWHVSQYSDEFFPGDQARFWAPGKMPQRLEDIAPEATASAGTCGFCEWPVPESEGWFIPVERGMTLGLSVDSCILCAQQQAAGLLILPEAGSLNASEARCDYWRREIETLDGPAGISETSEQPVEAASERDWQRVRRQLPLSWHPLCEQLERKLAPPVLHHRFAGYEGVAILAWPEHRRGIVANDQERERLPEGWEFWSMSSVLGSLG